MVRGAFFLRAASDLAIKAESNSTAFSESLRAKCGCVCVSNFNTQWIFVAMIAYRPNRAA
jgi:hypothetical protein